MPREIKFRVWTIKEKRYYPINEDPDYLISPSDAGLILIQNGDSVNSNDLVWQQYTGLKDKNGKDIYEGDIFRIEEDGDIEDITIYVVIVWVQEWCMFCTLRIDDEFPNYSANGAISLDEPMFWTYTLEDTNSRKHFLCGNIYENPDLLA